MMVRRAAAMGMLAVVLAACAGAPPQATEPAAVEPTRGEEPSAAATATPEAPPPETPAERKARVGKVKLERCQAMAQAVQSRGQTVLLNVHNGATLLGVAGELDESADVMDKVDIDMAELDALQRLRGAYATTSRAMAKALFATADASDFDARKAPLTEFRELEPKLRTVLSQLSEVCSAPVE